MAEPTPIETLEQVINYVQQAKGRMHPYVVAGDTTVADARCALAEVEAVVAALPDPEKLDQLAEWLDLDDVRRNRAGHDEVQQDLRMWASQARTALARFGKEGS